jgi:pimeloyl-ACP methyl ester carboxylesterase
MKHVTGALVLAGLALAGGCARLPATGVTPLRAATVSELRAQVLGRKPDVDLFRQRGPFVVDQRTNRELRLSATERIDTDLYLSSPAGKAPLVILLHGHDNTKADHAYQAFHLASWGLHSLAVTLPKNGPWIDNGRTLSRIAALIRSRPEILDRRIDADRIILAGHSYGAAAAAIALAVGAPASGGVLLDPAGIGKGLPGYLRKIDKPVMVIGADERVSAVHDRRHFYQYIRRNVREVSINEAHHEDGQFPFESAFRLISGDTNATPELQITFVSALTASAFSLAHTGSFDYAWASFGGALRSGRLFGARRK